MKFVLFFACALLGACSKPRPGIPARHLLLVTCEALRADVCSTYLAMRPTTSLPATEPERREGRAMGLDALAAGGVLFHDCTSPGAHPVAAMASLMTGLTPRSAGAEDAAALLPGDVPTLAELFTDAGFDTAAFVTARAFDPRTSVGRGFAEFRTSADDGATLAAALERLKRDPGDGSRRFTWIHLAGAVPPFAMGSRAEDVEALLAAKDFGDTLNDDELRALDRGVSPTDSAGHERFQRTYERAVARTAIALTRCLQDAFDYTRPEADVSETFARTVLVFTATDTGVAPAPANDDEPTRIPLWIRHPDSLTGERVLSTAVELRDLLPTFVEWFDLATPRRLEGGSLLPLLDSYVEREFVRPGAAPSGR